MRYLLLFTTLLIGLTLAEKMRYDNYTLYSITANDQEALKMLKNLERKPVFASNFWSPVRSVGVPVNIMISPKTKNHFDKLMSLYSIRSEVMMENIQEHIENQLVRKEPLLIAGAGSLDWENYHTLSEVSIAPMP